MKHAYDITLILPEHITRYQFEDIINSALKQAVEGYTTYYWDAEKNEEVEKILDIKKCSFNAIATGAKKDIVEFECKDS
jgi:hypothetical protein